MLPAGIDNLEYLALSALPEMRLIDNLPPISIKLCHVGTRFRNVAFYLNAARRKGVLGTSTRPDLRRRYQA